MSKKTMGMLVAVIGLLILLASVLADLLGMGNPGSGFGFRQVAGSVVGAIILIVGFLLARRSEG